MRLGAFTTFAPEYTFSEACKMIKAIGYEGVQPRIVPEGSAAGAFDPAKPLNPWGNNKGGVAEPDFFADPVGALKPATDIGLEITSVASYTGTADMERAVKMVQACGKAGIKNVRVSSLPMPKEETFDFPAFIAKSQGTYRELIAEAKKVGVRPCIELHMGTAYPGASGIYLFLKDFSPEDVGVLYDPGNMITEGWENVRLALNILGPYLAEVHVKNQKWIPAGEEDRGAAKWKTVSSDLEDGCVNWAEVVDKLKAHGYDGWLIEEGHTENRDSYTRLKLAYELLSKLLGG